MSNPAPIQPQQSTSRVLSPLDSFPQKVIASASIITLLGVTTIALSKAFGATYLTATITPVVFCTSIALLSLITLIALSCLGNPTHPAPPQKGAEAILAPQIERNQPVEGRVEPITPQIPQRVEAQIQEEEPVQEEEPLREEELTNQEPPQPRDEGRRANLFQRARSFFRRERAGTS